MINLGSAKAQYLIEQIERDTEFFRKIRAVDYSLLIGIHNRQRGDRELRTTRGGMHRWTEADSGGILSSDGNIIYYIG
jgi:hypothetical protein